MLTAHFYKGNRALGLILFFSLYAGLFQAQRKQEPEVARLLYSACNDNCYQAELRELTWSADSLQLIFAAENSCGSPFYAEVIPSGADTLSIAITTHASKGSRGSQQSVEQPGFLRMCLCHFEYRLTLRHMRYRPKVILINDRPYYLRMSELHKSHVKFAELYKNESAAVSTRDYSRLLGLPYASKKIIRLMDELGNDSIPDPETEAYHSISFPEDHIYLSFDAKNTLRSVIIEGGYEGKLLANLSYTGSCKACLSKLGRPSTTQTRHVMAFDAKTGEQVEVPLYTDYTFKKHRLFLTCDENDHIGNIRFSLDPQPE